MSASTTQSCGSDVRAKSRATASSVRSSQPETHTSLQSEIIRRHWVELGNRLWPFQLTNKLFQRKVLCKEDLEEFDTREPRHQGAQRLMMIMLTRSWDHFLDFATLLSKTIGAEDLGKKLLRDAASGKSDDDVYISREALLTTVKDLNARVEGLELDLGHERQEKVELQEQITQVKGTAKRQCLVNAALHLDKAREGCSYVCPYQWQDGSCLPHSGMFFNRFVVADGRAIAADWRKNQFYVCDLRSEQHSWTVVPNTNDAGHIYRLFTVGDKCFGTFYREDTKEQEQTIGLYHVGENVWTSVAGIPPNSALQWYGIVSDKERICVVGGWDATQTCLDTVLIYDVCTGLLCGKKKMSCKRRSCSCVIVDNTLYIAGGFFGSNGLNVVEAMSLTDYSCCFVAPTEMYRCSMAVLCGQLVASGGTTMPGDYSACSSIVSVFDPSIGVWLPLPNMNRKRLAHGMYAYDDDDTLFVIGGDDCESGQLHDLNSTEYLRRL